jgi:hypothetical protein
MHDFKIKQGDTRPSLEAQLLDENREPRDLQTVDEVRFHMKDVDTQEVVVDDTGSILNANEGRVVYEWSDGDTDTLGRHQAEFEVHYSDGGTETFPNGDNIEVYITEDLA